MIPVCARRAIALLTPGVVVGGLAPRLIPPTASVPRNVVADLAWVALLLGTRFSHWLLRNAAIVAAALRIISITGATDRRRQGHNGPTGVLQLDRGGRRCDHGRRREGADETIRVLQSDWSGPGGNRRRRRKGVMSDRRRLGHWAHH